MRRLERVTLIVSLCCICLGAVSASETVFITKTVLHLTNFSDVNLWNVADAFLPVIFILIINRKSFSMIVLLLYVVDVALLMPQAWLTYVGTPPFYPKFVAPTQAQVLFLSVPCFVFYLLVAVFRKMINTRR